MNSPFDIHTPDSLQAAREGLPFVGEYTIFNKENVLQPDPQRILAIADALGTDKIGSLVTYTPERIALHWTVAAMALTGRFQKEPEFSQSVMRVYERHVKPHIGETAFELRQVWNSAQAAGEGVQGDIAAKKAYDAHPAQKKLADMARQGVEEAIREKEIEPLTLLPNKEAKALLVCAASGSGKTTVAKQRVSAYLEHAGRRPDDFALITRDRFTPLLVGNFDAMHEKVGSALGWIGYDETGHIMQKCMAPLIAGMIKSGKGIPLLSLERVTDLESNIAMLAGKGVETHAYFIHVPLETALSRVTLRAQLPAEQVEHHGDYKKVIPSAEMLKMHHDVSETFIKLPSHQANMVFELLDNTGRLGEEHKRIAFGHLGKKELNVYDPVKLAEYMHKGHINIAAKSSAEVYDRPPSADETASYIKHFDTVHFADPVSNDIYATFTPKGGLHIDGKRIYAAMREDAFTAELFDAIQGVPHRVKREELQEARPI